jgi:hypothetical protein
MRLLAPSAARLAVLLLVREERLAPVPQHAGPEMPELEELLRTHLRRSDVLLYVGADCLAVILLGADRSGACAVVRRLHQALRVSMGQVCAFSLGLAVADDPAHVAERLVAQALEGRRAFLPVLDETLLADAGEAAALGAKEGSGGLRRPRPATRVHRPYRTARTSQPLVVLEPPMRPEVAAAQARARQLGVPYLAPPQSIPGSVRDLVPPELMRQHRCLPVGRDRNTLTVALADPTDSGALSHLEQVTGLTIFPVMTDPELLESLEPGGRLLSAAQEGPRL